MLLSVVFCVEAYLQRVINQLINQSLLALGKQYNLRNFIHQANVIDNIQYKIETIIITQTKTLEGQFKFTYALVPQYVHTR